MKTTKIIHIKDKDLYNALTILQDVNMLEEFLFSDCVIENCPIESSAFYFKLSSYAYERITKNLISTLENATNLLKEVYHCGIDTKFCEYTLNKFAIVCEENNTTEYFIINK